jgi:predicted SprT family Zn-dependent metalloprotease
MTDIENTYRCLNCERTESQIPLVNLRYQGQMAFICSQCLPLLIHQPQALVGKLRGAEEMAGSPHHDD